MYIIIYDFGTSSVKTCLFHIDSQIHLIAGSTAEYGLYISDDGGAEQDTEEWWAALVVAAGIKSVDVLELSRQLDKANHVYIPNSENKKVYERNYRVFKNLYKSNAPYYKQLNS